MSRSGIRFVLISGFNEKKYCSNSDSDRGVKHINIIINRSTHLLYVEEKMLHILVWVSSFLAAALGKPGFIKKEKKYDFPIFNFITRVRVCRVRKKTEKFKEKRKKSKSSS